MATLKTDFSDGDIFYSGAITDTDKLNGITTQINLKNKIQEIYTSTGFDSTSPAGGVNEESHEFTAITAANLININYLKINNGTYFFNI